MPTLFVFLGSTIGNFNHSDFPRFFRALSEAMGPNDYLLLGADRIKDTTLLEQAYDDSQGLTAQFILNVFRHINDLLGSNFDLAKMRYHARFNSEWQQIEMYAIAEQRHTVSFPTVETSFDWQKDEKILVEISRKFDPQRLTGTVKIFRSGTYRALHRSQSMVFGSALPQARLNLDIYRSCRIVCRRRNALEISWLPAVF